jgi:hypothetical protein
MKKIIFTIFLFSISLFSQAVTFTITPEWKNVVDNDGDGKWSYAELRFKIDAVPDDDYPLYNFKVQYKRAWGLWNTCSTGQLVDLSWTHGVNFTDLNDATYHFRIKIENFWGNDVLVVDQDDFAFLGNVEFEPPSEDLLTFLIPTASWSNEVDEDGDGYTRYRKLQYQIKRSSLPSQSVNVTVKVFKKLSSSSTYALWSTFPNHNMDSNIENISTEVGNLEHGIYDFKIELYNNDDGGKLVAERDYYLDSDLYQEKFETASQDNPVTLSSITISGPTTVNENSSANYTCTANYSDGSTQNVTSSASWSENSSYATINSSGVLTTSSVSSDKSCTITASYGGKSDTYNVTIKDIPPTFNISNAFWGTEVDEDTDGYTQARRLYFDINVSSGTHLIYAKIYVKESSESNGSLYFTTGNFQVSSNGTTRQNVIIGLPNTELSHNVYDFWIYIYFEGDASTLDLLRWDEDSDLFQEKFETASQDNPVTLSSITISGATSVNENSSSSYTCTANYSDGSTQNITNSASWSENSSYATINSSGVLTTSSVSSDQSCTITASYGGKSDTHNITIKNNTTTTFDVSPNSRNVGSTSGSTSFTVNSDVGWNVEDDASWLIATKTNGSTISVSYDANTSTNTRTANIRAYGTGGVEEIVTVTQTGTSSTNHAPNKPVITSPGEGEVVPLVISPTTGHKIFTIEWDCSDPDGDELSYIVSISRTESGLTTAQRHERTTTSISLYFINPDYDYKGVWYSRVIAKDKQDSTVSDIRMFELDWPTALDDVSINNMIMVYPNPAQEKVNIKISNPDYLTFDIEIYNLQGKLLLKKAINSNITSIDIQSFNPGLYFIIAKNQKIKYTEKLIVK